MNISLKDRIKNTLVLEDTVLFLRNTLEQQDNKQQYQLEIGKVLYGNGIRADEYIVTPYNIFNTENGFFTCQISVCFGDEIYSTEYNSKFEPKEPIAIRRGYIFFVYGRFTANKIKIIWLDLLKWPTNIPLMELKARVQWDSFPIIYDNIPVHLNEQNTELEHEYFRKYNGDHFFNIDTITDTSVIEISNFGRIRIDNKIIKQSENNGFLYVFNYIKVHTLIREVFFENPIGLHPHIHHIDNNGYNNNITNLINVTREQHASIHLFMWNKYYFEDDRLEELYETYRSAGT